MVHPFSYQLAIFFSTEIARPDKFFDNLNDSIGNLFNSMPQVTPLPAEVPPELPRVTVKTKDNTYSCSVSLNRMEFTSHIVDSKLKELEGIADFVLKSKLVLNNLPEEIKLVRFGLIGHYFSIEKNAATSLSKKMLRKDLGNLSELTVNYNKISHDFGLDFNNLYNISSAQINRSGIDSEGFFIQKDFNNVPSERDLKRDFIIDIISKKIKDFHTDKIEGVI